jgi:protein transport protein SEC61 subunit gamma-like protein
MIMEPDQQPEENKEGLRLVKPAADPSLQTTLPASRPAPLPASKPVQQPAAKQEEETVEEEINDEGSGFKMPSFSLSSLPEKIMNTLREYRRVITVSKKPNIEEISKITKIACAGIAVMGLIGFAIQIVFQLLLRGA